MTDARLDPANRPVTAAPPIGRASPQSYLRTEASHRAQSFGLIIAFLCLLVLGLVPCLGQSAPMSAAVGVALFLLATVSLAGSWYARKKAHYPVALFRVHGFVAVVSAAMIQYYLGVFSPTAVAVAFGLAFFGQGEDTLTAWAIGIGAAASYALLALLLTLGWVEDRGVFHADHVGIAGKIFMMSVVPVVMLLTVAQARSNLRASRELVDRVAEAARRAERDHAQLQEVAQELDVVRRASTNTPGHWTGRKISRFQLGGVLGRGASGEVYEARDPNTGEQLAVKLLRGGIRNDPVSLHRFEREGYVAARLASPHTVRVWELGLADDGTPYLVMERVSGRDLAGVVRDRGTLREGEVLQLLEEICEALAEAHGLGVVHRDVKPGNLILSDDGVWKLLDFGAAALEAPDSGLTLAGETIGTPNYMSPEQARAERVDVRTDLYSLSAVAYRALTGHVPHTAPSAVATLVRIAQGDRPRAPRALVPTLSPEVDALLAIGLAQDLEYRYQSAADLAAAVRAIRGRRGEALHARAQSALSAAPWGA